MSVEGIEEVTGFRVTRAGVSNGWAKTTEKGFARGLGLSTWGGGVQEGAAPLFSPTVRPGDEVWATYRDAPDLPALVARRRGEGTGYDIFLGPGQLFRELIHVAAKTAGVHCYLDSTVGNVIASDGYVVVQNTTDRPLTVTLRDGTRHTLEIPKGATRILTERP